MCDVHLPATEASYTCVCVSCVEELIPSLVRCEFQVHIDYQKFSNIRKLKSVWCALVCYRSLLHYLRVGMGCFNFESLLGLSCQRLLCLRDRTTGSDVLLRAKYGCKPAHRLYNSCYHKIVPLIN